MTIEELAKKYYEELKRNPNERTVNSVVKSINALTYTDSDRPISQEDKEKITKAIVENYHGKLLEHSDNSSLLQMIALVNEKIKGK